jgi:hypothetical protein
MMTEPHIEAFVLEDDGTFPNNSLPVILYRQAIPVGGRTRPGPLRNASGRTVGAASGATASSTTTTTMQPPTRCSHAPVGPFAFN